MLIVIQVIINALLVLFVKTCVVKKNGKNIPNIFPISIILLSFFPVLGMISFMVFAIYFILYTAPGGDYKLKDNKFNRFLFGI